MHLPKTTRPVFGFKDVQLETLKMYLKYNYVGLILIEISVVLRFDPCRMLWPPAELRAKLEKTTFLRVAYNVAYALSLTYVEKIYI